MNSSFLTARLPRILALALMLVVIGGMFGRSMQLSPLSPTSGTRITPIVAVFHGYSLYPGVADGPIHGWIYGPIAAFWNAPALLGNTPSDAVKWAFAANVLGILIAAGIAMQGVAKLFSTVRSLAVGIMILILVWIPATRYWTLNLNADVTAVMFSTAGIALAAHPRLSWMRIACVAALLALAVFSKQNAAFVPPAICVALWASGRLPEALRLAIATCLSVTLFAVICAKVWGAEGVWLNLIEIPANHPFSSHGIWKAVLFFAVWITPLCVIYLLGSRFFVFRNEAEVRARAASARLFFFTGILSLPIGFAGTAKIGGDVNSFHSSFYLVAAVMLSLPWKRWWHTWPWTMLLLPSALAVSITVFLGFTNPMWRNLRIYPDDLKFARMKDEPGMFFFPFEPHLSLMRDGVLYDSEYGIFDRVIAGIEVSVLELQAHTPRDAKFVVYPDIARTHILLEAYPGFQLIDKASGYERYALPDAVVDQVDK